MNQRPKVGDLVASPLGTPSLVMRVGECGATGCNGDVGIRHLGHGPNAMVKCYPNWKLTFIAPAAELSATEPQPASNGSDDDLDAILGDAMVGDEYEDGDGYSRNGLRRVVDDTDIPEKLIAWRDAAVKAALAGAVQQIRDNPMWATATSRDNATEAAEWFAGLIGDSKS